MPRQLGSPKIRAAYRFLTQLEIEKREFTIEELSAASGWKDSNAKANVTKKLAPLLLKTPNGYLCHSIRGLSEEAFCRLCSQNSALSVDLRKPTFPPKVEGYINKASQAALAAVQHYNNPTAQFRSANYIILMVVAFTSLLHAVYEYSGVDYIERKNDGTPKVTGDGDIMLWDLSRSVKYYEGGNETTLTKNIELLTKVRNKIEHQYLPELDADIHGHCQSMLMNFERVLVKEFTGYYALNTSLAMALQFSTERNSQTVEALRRFQNAEYDAIKRYLADFEANLPDTMRVDPLFAFRVWLLPKTVNHINQSDISIEFVPFGSIPPDLVEALEKHIVAEKQITREVRNVDYLRPTEVCKRVVAAIGRNFHSWHHKKAYLFHQVRPIVNVVNPAKTNTKYCVWDMTFKQYLYTQAWVDFLIEEYTDEEKYSSTFVK